MAASNESASYGFYDRARALMDTGDLESAIRFFEQSAALEPHFKTLELLGECYISLGRFRQSIVPLAAATSLNRQPRAPALLAEAFYQLGDKSAAVDFARLALERAPGNKAALAVLAKLDVGQ